MVYTDGQHLIADTPAQLHSFAQYIGLRRGWFQDHRHPHYDLTTPRMAEIAIDAGAVEVSTRSLVMLSKYAQALNRLEMLRRINMILEAKEHSPPVFHV